MPSINLKGAGPKPPSVTPSPQQADAIAFARFEQGNAILEAVAGSGKTWTLIEMCKYLDGGVAYAAFNKKIADEIGRKLMDAGAGQGVRAATFHSFGFQAWRKVAPRVQVEGKKSDIIMDYLDVPRNLRGFVGTLTSIAKQAGIGIICRLDDYQAYDVIVDHHDLTDKLYQGDRTLSISDVEDLTAQGIEWAQRLMFKSIEDNEKMIDFDDMIYAPLYHNATFWQYDWVLVDEAQDTNPVRRMLAAAMLKPNGRLIAVGDRRQAIYGFTGADNDALDLIARTFDAKLLPLTVTFRCAQAIVRHAQKIVPHIEAHPDAPEGEVSFIGEEDFRVIRPDPTDAIICRNTKPLIELALRYIRGGIAAHVEGRDIGQSLIALCRKWRKPKTVRELSNQLVDWLQDEMIRLTERGNEQKIEQVQDRVESLFAIMEQMRDDDPVEAVIDRINSIFKDTEGRDVASITLSTVHKAKGREWDTVYLYGRNVYMPSPFARQVWQIEQENNLIYVAITRARKKLVEVDLIGRR